MSCTRVAWVVSAFVLNANPRLIKSCAEQSTSVCVCPVNGGAGCPGQSEGQPDGARELEPQGLGSLLPRGPGDRAALGGTGMRVPRPRAPQALPGPAEHQVLRGHRGASEGPFLPHLVGSRHRSSCRCPPPLVPASGTCGCHPHAALTTRRGHRRGVESSPRPSAATRGPVTAVPDPGWRAGVGGQPYRRLLPGVTQMWVRVTWEVPQLTCAAPEKPPSF